jgi:hypothetical protein
VPRDQVSARSVFHDPGPIDATSPRAEYSQDKTDSAQRRNALSRVSIVATSILCVDDGGSVVEQGVSGVHDATVVHAAVDRLGHGGEIRLSARKDALRRSLVVHCPVTTTGEGRRTYQQDKRCERERVTPAECGAVHPDPVRYPTASRASTFQSKWGTESSI